MNRYILVLLLILAPAALAAQQDPAARIRAATQRAVAAGVPATLLESRVAEGRAKGVPMDRIAEAVERRAASLIRAQTLLRGEVRTPSTSELAAGADALEAGIGENALRTLSRQARPEDRAVAIAVLTFLHRERGISVDRALAQVRDAMARGPEALRNLPNRTGPGQSRGGGPPEGVGKRPAHAAQRRGGGPPAALPAPGEKPGAGRPDAPGRPKDKGPPPGRGRGGGKGRGG